VARLCGRPVHAHIPSIPGFNPRLAHAVSREIDRRKEYFGPESVYHGTNTMAARSSPSGMTQG
jgi:hypothetical protein